MDVFLLFAYGKFDDKAVPRGWGSYLSGKIRLPLVTEMRFSCASRNPSPAFFNGEEID